MKTNRNPRKSRLSSGGSAFGEAVGNHLRIAYIHMVRPEGEIVKRKFNLWLVGAGKSDSAVEFGLRFAKHRGIMTVGTAGH